MPKHNSNSLALGDEKQFPRPDWERPKAIAHRFSISLSSVYNLIADGKIKTSPVKIRGKTRNIRLVSVASVEALFNSTAIGSETAVQTTN